MAEEFDRLPTESSGLLTLPNELVDQIVRGLSDKDLRNLRVTCKCLSNVTLEAWKKRARRERGGLPALEWAAKNNRPSLINYLLSTFSDMEVNSARAGSCSNPLCLASGLGNNEAVMALIGHGADANYISGANSALVQAVRRFHNTAVQMLLEAGADPYVLDYAGSNILQAAARRNHAETLQVILDRMEAYPESMPGINDFNPQGLTALHLASAAGALSAAILLLESGADIDAACERSEFVTPLARAVGFSSPDRVNMVKLLLSWGADVDGRTTGSQSITNFDTPLHIAVQRELPDIHILVPILIDNGAALDVLDKTGFTVLQSVLHNRNIRIMRLILDAGGDVNTVDDGGSSALHLLASWPITEFTYEALILLERRGADKFLVNNAGMTPRDLALQSGWDPETVEKTWGSSVFIPTTAS